MFDYCYKYNSGANGLIFSMIEVVAPEPGVTKVTLQVNRSLNNLEVNVYFTGDYTKEEAQVCADDVASWAINQLSRHTNRYLGDLKFHSGDRIAIHADGTQTIVDYGYTEPVHIGISCGFDIDTPENQAETIKAILNPRRQPADDNFAAYRAALISDDAVACYMSLYLILMSYHKDSVTATDKYIKLSGAELEFELEIERANFVDAKGVTRETDETVFTRLRNQVVHNRAVVTASTRTGMQTHIGKLMLVVKKCLEEHAPICPSR